MPRRQAMPAVPHRLLSSTCQIALHVVTTSRCQQYAPSPVRQFISDVILQALHIVSHVRSTLVFLAWNSPAPSPLFAIAFTDSAAAPAAVISRGRLCSPCTYAAAAACSRLSKRTVASFNRLASTPACKTTSYHLWRRHCHLFRALSLLDRHAPGTHKHCQMHGARTQSAALS